MGYNTEMDGCGRCVKFALLILNFIIFIGGLCLVGLGIWALVDKVHYVSELTGNNLITGTLFVLLVSGILTIIVSVMGCIGASREIKIVLFMYALAMLLLFVVILIGGALGYVFREQFVETLKTQMTNSMQLYKQKREVTEGWDYVQSKLHCCGVNSWNDWSKYLTEIPRSCCREVPNNAYSSISRSCNLYPDQSNIYPWGCRDATEHFMQRHAAVLGGAGFTVAIILFGGMVCAFILFNKIR